MRFQGKQPFSTRIVTSASTAPQLNVTIEGESIHVSRTSLIVGGVILISASLYLVVALATHRVIRKRTIKREITVTSGSVRGSKVAQNTRSLDNLSLLASVFALLNCVSDQPIVYSQSVSTTTCKALQLLSYIFYSSGHVCLYLFLWMRQRACYKSPSLALMHNKFARVLSAVIMPVFVTMTIVGVVLTGVAWTFDSSPDGCIETEKNRVPLIVLFAGSTTMQVTLLLLFIYPLKRHTNMLMERSHITSPSEKLLTNLVKRSIIITSLCVLADGLAFTLAMLLDYSLPFIYINYIYDANLICNVISIIGSFANWRNRLGLCCAEKNNFRKKPSAASQKTSTHV